MTDIWLPLMALGYCSFIDFHPKTVRRKKKTGRPVNEPRGGLHKKRQTGVPVAAELNEVLR
jgi:hypothetical protein